MDPWATNAWSQPTQSDPISSQPSWPTANALNHTESASWPSKIPSHTDQDHQSTPSSPIFPTNTLTIDSPAWPTSDHVPDLTPISDHPVYSSPSYNQQSPAQDHSGLNGSSNVSTDPQDSSPDVPATSDHTWGDFNESVLQVNLPVRKVKSPVLQASLDDGWNGNIALDEWQPPPVPSLPTSILSPSQQHESNSSPSWEPSRLEHPSDLDLANEDDAEVEDVIDARTESQPRENYQPVRVNTFVTLYMSFC